MLQRISHQIANMSQITLLNMQCFVFVFCFVLFLFFFFVKSDEVMKNLNNLTLDHAISKISLSIL